MIKNLKTKTGAMFGLDARIALAIFGALSVISGAALYSAIQQSKVVANVAEMVELGKAWEQYYLDTGEHLPSVGGTNHVPCYRNLKNLISPTVIPKGWAGPYVSNSEGSANSILNHDEFDRVTVFIFPDTTWGSGSDWGNTCDCPADSCKLWIEYAGVPKDLAVSIDKHIDGSISENSGDLRVWKKTSDKYSIYYKYAPAPRMN